MRKPTRGGELTGLNPFFNVFTHDDTRDITFMGEVSEGSVSEFFAQFRTLDSIPGDIRVNMSSIGGDVDAGWAMHDLIRCANNKVTIVGYGYLYSMASLILQAADLRLVTPNCRIMFHNGSVDLGDQDPERLRQAAQAACTDTLHYVRTIANRSGVSVRRLRRMTSRETYLNAIQAVNLGLVDQIIQMKELGIKKATRRK